LAFMGFWWVLLKKFSVVSPISKKMLYLMNHVHL